MAPSADEWVNLDRQFYVLKDASAESTARLYSGLAQTLFGWTSVLAKRFTVVLGEAGAGKTREFHGMASALQRDGTFAFFLTVENLASIGLEKGISLGDRSRFKAWQTASAHAYFFLDSVDEASLKNLQLETALKNCFDELGENVHRASFIVSSRLSDWSHVDNAATLEFLGALNLEADDLASRYICLAALDEPRIHRFAETLGVADWQDFVAAVRRTNSWVFLERPGDVKWLCDHWNSHKTIERLARMIDSSINHRLAEKSMRVTSISPEKAREGAAMLACIATLTQRPEIELPKSHDSARIAETPFSLDPTQVLSDWTNEERSDLLSRGIFDEATYGRVRFHHRTIVEYLAAEWLHKMAQSGHSTADRDALLIRQTSQGKKVPRHLSAVAAWLSLREPDLRRVLGREAPECLIDEGDPSSLPPTERPGVLKRYFELHADRGETYTDFSPMGLQRFSCPELVDTLREMLRSTEQSPHLLQTALRLIEKGQLRELLDEAIRLALDPGADLNVRIQSVTSVISIGNSSHHQELAVLLQKPESLSRDLAGPLLQGLFPSIVTVEHLAGLLLAIPFDSTIRVTNFDVLLPRLPDRLTPEQRLNLLRSLVTGLTGLIGCDASPNATGVRRAASLSALLLALLPSAVGSFYGADELADSALRILANARNDHVYASPAGLSEAIDKLPDLRRQVFWHRVYIGKKSLRRFPRTIWEINDFYDTWQLGSNTCDRDWLTSDCLDIPEARNRVFAFGALTEVVRKSPETFPEGTDAFLDRVAQNSDQRHGSSALRKRLDRMRNPRLPDAPADLSRYLRAERLRNLRQKRTHDANRHALQSRITEIASGTDVHLLYWLQEEFRFGNDSRDSSTIHPKIAEQYGNEIASAFVDGARRFWRDFEPSGPEGFSPNETPHFGILGLLGIALELAEGLNLVEVSGDIARKAIIYATWKRSGFPRWIDSLAKCHAALIEEIYRPSIELDFLEQPANNVQPLGRLLWKLADASPQLRRACAQAVFAMLEQNEPGTSDRLRDAIDVISSDEAMREGLLSLVEAKLRTPAYPIERAVHLFRYMVSTAPGRAVDALCEAARASTDASLLVVSTFAELIRLSHLYDNALLSQLRTDRCALSKLARIAYSNIPLDTDDDKTEPRATRPLDSANGLRGSLIHWLSLIPGEESVQCLLELASLPMDSRQRNWLLHLADTRALDDCSSDPVSVPAAIKFAKENLREVENTAGLHETALNRLKDIGHALHHDDFSYRSVFDPEDEAITEDVVQKYVANQLDFRRRGQYDVSRETEVIEKNRTDIRLTCPKCVGPVTIEVKIAERWSYSALSAALKDQIVDKYMRANSSRYGILLLCSSGPQRTWKNPVLDAQPLTFAELSEALAREASALVAREEAVARLDVVALDFH